MALSKRSERRAAWEAGAGTARWARWRAMSLGSRISICVLALIALSAILAPLLSPHDPQAIAAKALPPSGEFWFGTDNLGRDVFSRLLYGGRYSLAVGLIATGIALACAAVLGSLAAVSRKAVDEVIMRIMDIIMAVPAIALAAVAVVVFRNPDEPESTIYVIIGAIAFVYVPQLTRIVRANVLAQYGKDYVSAVIVSGARAPWILARHVMRNCAAPVLVFATLLVADAIILEASLTFIGAGLQEPIATWGNILSAAQPGVLRGEWWQALFPGIMIMVTVLCLNIVSEGITDAMVASPAAAGPAPGATAEAAQEQQGAAPAAGAQDPAAAHAAQAELLGQRLAALSDVEKRRTDRLPRDPAAPVLLEVRDLSIAFPRHGDVSVVDKVSFKVRKGESMGLVGESGCGKSITALAIMGLLDPEAEICGQALYEGRDLLSMPPKERQGLLGHELAMIYQDALSALNPSMLIRAQLEQLIRRGGTRSATELMELVGLDPERTLGSYPHELSGGQRQRVLIAMALTRDPKLIIADEPTTALDVTVQKQVIDLLGRLREELGFAMIFVSHDLALVAEVAHRITVMYAGQVVEQAPTSELLLRPTHEYTRGLLGAVLSIESGSGRLHQIPGVVPSPRDFPRGDRFAPRSSHPGYGEDIEPVLAPVGPPEAEHFCATLPDRPNATATATATATAAQEDKQP